MLKYDTVVTGVEIFCLNPTPLNLVSQENTEGVGVIIYLVLSTEKTQQKSVCFLNK